MVSKQRRGGKLQEKKCWRGSSKCLKEWGLDKKRVEKKQGARL